MFFFCTGAGMATGYLAIPGFTVRRSTPGLSSPRLNLRLLQVLQSSQSLPTIRTTTYLYWRNQVLAVTLEATGLLTQCKRGCSVIKGGGRTPAQRPQRHKHQREVSIATIRAGPRIQWSQARTMRSMLLGPKRARRLTQARQRGHTF